MSKSDADRRYRLDGQTAVVTGASSGIGRAIALELAAAGAKVVVHAAKNLVGAEETAELVRRLGTEACVVLADLAADDASQACEGFIAHAWSWQGGVDVWVNNAGADVLSPPVSLWSFEEKLQLLWKVDVLGAIRLSRAIAAKMTSRSDGPRGVILNMGWDQAEHGMAGDSGEMFGPIKGAVMAFTRSLAQSVAPHVRVHCLAPGWIRTSWGAQASDYWQTRAIAESLRGRWGTPEDVAGVARFLASDAADFLTGQVVPINGGWKRSERTE